MLAFVYAFTIIFREGLEAVLVVAAVLGYLEASRNTQYRGAVLKGVGGAVVATILLFIGTTLFVQLAPLQRELLEAGTALLAVGVLFYVSFWLITRLEHRRWMEFMKAKVWAAATTGSTLALAGVGFTAVFREGFETTLFFQALISFAEGLLPYVAGGTALGIAVLAVIGWVIFKAGRKIPVRTFLTTAVVLVMVLSVAFVGNAVRGFQEATYLPVTFIESLPDLPIFVAQLTGWYPTRETILAQGALWRWSTSWVRYLDVRRSATARARRAQRTRRRRRCGRRKPSGSRRRSDGGQDRCRRRRHLHQGGRVRRDAAVEWSHVRSCRLATAR